MVQLKISYLAWLCGLMWTANRNLPAGQERNKHDFDNRIRYPTPDYQASDQVLVNREAALPSEEKTDKDRVNYRPAPRVEGLFPVVQVLDHTVIILRGTGLKYGLSRDRVVKSPSLSSNVEGLPPQLVELEGKDGNFADAAPSKSTCSITAEQDWI